MKGRDPSFHGMASQHQVANEVEDAVTDRLGRDVHPADDATAHQERRRAR
jgi:hypothetical protein